MIEAIATALVIHLGKTAIDRFWPAVKAGAAPAIDTAGIVHSTSSHGGRTVVDEALTAEPWQESCTVLGELYLAETVNEILHGDEVALVLVIEETRQDVLLFEASLSHGYEMHLPRGIYSFYAFLLDGLADDLLTAELYAIGLRSIVDLSDIDRLTLEDHNDIWDLVAEDPVELTGRRPRVMDFLLIDTERVPELPRSFEELFGGAAAGRPAAASDLTGAWRLKETYQFGQATAEVYLVQVGTELYGNVVRNDLADTGEEWLVQEAVAGVVQGRSVVLRGTHVRVLKGSSTEYELDEWAGYIIDSQRIAGASTDMAGVTGEFLMERA